MVHSARLVIIVRRTRQFLLHVRTIQLGCRLTERSQAIVDHVQAGTSATPATLCLNRALLVFTVQRDYLRFLVLYIGIIPSLHRATLRHVSHVLLDTSAMSPASLITST